ncbi:YeeE/YedE family protein [Qipengyuania sp. 1NDH17]|uniref:YeeE/YedE family protein n=1 Tax=Qipengyuania polymorpha TaxID=2867234 RepID=A0ABS7J2V2_9SPHN|nr:YeeE/YedE thiosulfate transporter family protein [Qipengyuania polymorpha]MBX7458409.1 YeeE/YedE family protein [Qipengyuania polymorpha]
MMLPGFPDAAPLEGFAGGLLIGLAAALMLLGLGRIAGVSGIAGRAFAINSSSLPKSSAWAFLVGLPVGAILIVLATSAERPEFAGWPIILTAGLIVGFGTRMGSGCTSGHGVCGLSRFSQRSIVATLTFIATGVATVFIMGALS